MRGLYPSMAFGPTHMKAVLQEDLTGCGIACVANLANVSYQQVKSVAVTWGMTSAICVSGPIRPSFKYCWTIMESIPAGRISFRSWQPLPPLALLSTKWYRKNNQAFWQWVIYWKNPAGPVMLDSKFTLRKQVRTDLGRIKPRGLGTVHDRIWGMPIRKFFEVYLLVLKAFSLRIIKKIVTISHYFKLFFIPIHPALFLSCREMAQVRSNRPLEGAPWSRICQYTGKFDILLKSRLDRTIIFLRCAFVISLSHH